MKSFTFFAFVFIFYFFNTSLLQAVDSFKIRSKKNDLGALVYSLEGAKFINVITKSGDSRAVKTGEMVQVGEQVQMKSGISCRLAFEMGMQVLLDSKTIIKILRGSGPNQNQAPVIEQKTGRARYYMSPKVAWSQGKYRFYIQAKRAVLGVRGTDFIVSNLENRTMVHTISGEVDVALSVKDLKRRKLLPLEEERYVSVVGNEQKLTQMRRYRLSVYLKKVYKRQPSWKLMMEQAKVDIKSGGIKKAFHRYKQARWDLGFDVTAESEDFEEYESLKPVSEEFVRQKTQEVKSQVRDSLQQIRDYTFITATDGVQQQLLGRF